MASGASSGDGQFAHGHLPPRRRQLDGPVHAVQNAPVECGRVSAHGSAERRDPCPADVAAEDWERCGSMADSLSRFCARAPFLRAAGGRFARSSFPRRLARGLHRSGTWQLEMLMQLLAEHSDSTYLLELGDGDPGPVDTVRR